MYFDVNRHWGLGTFGLGHRGRLSGGRDLWLWPLSAVLGVASTAAGQVQLLDAQRSVFARATWEAVPWCFAEDEQTVVPDPGNVFDAWGEAANAHAECTPGFFSSATTKQKSQFLKSLFIIHVDSLGVMKGEFESVPGVDMHSRASVDFSVSRTTSAHLDGLLEWGGEAPAGIGAALHARLQVLDAGGTEVALHEASPSSGIPTINLDEVVVLAPGSYTLHAEAREVGVSGFGETSATAVVSVSVNFSCYADCDASGSLDFFDFLCFQNEFATGQSYADCDNSGSLDFFDFLCFQNAFAATCN